MHWYYSNHNRFHVCKASLHFLGFEHSDRSISFWARCQHHSGQLHQNKELFHSLLAPNANVRTNHTKACDFGTPRANGSLITDEQRMQPEQGHACTTKPADLAAYFHDVVVLPTTASICSRYLWVSSGSTTFTALALPHS